MRARPWRLRLVLLTRTRTHVRATPPTRVFVRGQAFCSAYAASKFGLEGWMESLRYEVEPFGIQKTIVEPGFFRTTLLEKESTT